MAVSRNTVTSAVIVVLVGVAWATVRAQQGVASSSGSLAELTAEVRLLRVAIQEGGRTQTQVQALSLALSAQQNRLTQVTAQLDKCDDDFRAASKKTQEVMKIVNEFQGILGRQLSADDRLGALRNLEAAKADAAPFVDEENRLRQRQQELTATLRTEEARWHELVSKLEEIFKR